jgi:dTDP-4-dehydrorhamnose 3,5-epimerase
MKVERLASASGNALSGPLLLTPQVFVDERGCFFESWNQRAFAAALKADGQIVPSFVQDNQSQSTRGVLRGLHYQLPPRSQGKLVRCGVGEVFDVIVDIRSSSPTCGHWASVRLNGISHKQLWIPQGFAHGFLALSDQAQLLYKTTDFWSPECERIIRWDHPDLAIDWPLWELDGMDPILSKNDTFRQVRIQFADMDLLA